MRMSEWIWYGMDGLNKKYGIQRFILQDFFQGLL